MILLIDALDSFTYNLVQASRLCPRRAQPEQAGASSGGRCDRSSKGRAYEEVAA